MGKGQTYKLSKCRIDPVCMVEKLDSMPLLCYKGLEIKEVRKMKKISTEEIVQEFSKMLQVEVDKYMDTHYPETSRTSNRELVSVKPGRKYIKIDVGHSGKFMFDTTDGHLYFIKGYGVINRKKDFGYLPSIIEKGFDYDGYSIVSAGTKYASKYGFAGKIGE